MNHPYVKKATLGFFILAGLTIVSALLGHIMPASKEAATSGLLWLVLLSVALKGQQITDIFMELKDAPRMWRGLLLAYVTVLPLTIGLVYWL